MPPPVTEKLVPPPASAKPASVCGEKAYSAPAAVPNRRLVALFDPCAALPSVVCDPPKPAAHTLQRCSKGGGALASMA